MNFKVFVTNRKIVNRKILIKYNNDPHQTGSHQAIRPSGQQAPEGPDMVQMSSNINNSL